MIDLIICMLCSIGAAVAVDLLERGIWWAPIFGLFVQTPWVVYCINPERWPLIICTSYFIYIYGRGARKALRERRKQ